MIKRIKFWMIEKLFPSFRTKVAEKVVWDLDDSKVLMDFMSKGTGQKMKKFLEMEGDAITDFAVGQTQNSRFEAGKATGYKLAKNSIEWLMNPQSKNRFTTNGAKPEARSLRERISL